MTTQVSTAKKSYFIDYLIHRIKEQKVQFILSVIFNILCIPALSTALCVYVCDYCDKYTQSYFAQNTVFMNEMLTLFTCIGIGAALILIALPMFGVSKAFTYFHSKNACDMYLSLPLTHRQRFWADFTSGLIVNFTPYIFSAVYGLVMAVFTDIRVHAVITDSYLDLDGLTLFVAVVFATLFVVMLGSYILAVFIKSCCGTAGAATMFTTVASVALPCFAALTTYFITDCARGIYGDYSLTLDVIRFIPPFGTLIADIINVINCMIQNAQDGLFSTNCFTLVGPEVIGLIAVPALMVVGSYYMSKRRKAEKVGEAFVYSAVYHVISYIVLASVALFVVLIAPPDANWVYVVTTVLVTAVIYMFMELSRKRSFKKFYMSILRYVGMVAISLEAMHVMYITDGFGIGGYVPPAQDVAKVSVKTNEYTDLPLCNMLVEFSDEDDIRTITSAHREMLDGVADGYYVQLEYTMKNGNTVKRYYNVLSDNYQEFVSSIRNCYIEKVYNDLLSAENNEKSATVVSEEWYKGEGIIGNEYWTELFETLKQEELEYTDGDGSIAAVLQTVVYVNGYGYRDYTIAIRDCYTKTLAVIGRAAQYNELSNLLLIEHDNFSGDFPLQLHTYITNEAYETPIMQELTELLTLDFNYSSTTRISYSYVDLYVRSEDEEKLNLLLYQYARVYDDAYSRGDYMCYFPEQEYNYEE